MNDLCVRITLDIQDLSTPVFVPVKRGDSGRNIIISLVDGGFPYEIQADAYAVLTGTKPDGNILYNHCEIDGNTIVYEITEQTTAVAGRILCTVKLYGSDDSLITSAIFRIIVDGTVYVEKEVESSSEFSALTQLISEANSLIDDVNEKLENGEFVGPEGPAAKSTSFTMKRFAKGDLQGATNSAKSGLKLIEVTTDPATGSFSQTENYVFDGDGIDSVTVEMLEPGSEPTAELGQNLSAGARVLKLGIPGPDSGQNVALTTAQINALDGMFKVCAFTKIDVSTEYTAFLTAFGISGGDEPVVPEVTLSSISAVYSGGSVAVGTAVTALTGVVVTAHYSDGSTATVTGYTLSGTIAEGSNTVTVTYQGKTATFTVTGVAESGGDDSGGGDGEEPGEIVYYAGYQINNGQVSVNNTRCMAVQSTGNVAFSPGSTGLNVYPIVIPSGATKVKATSPSPAYFNTFKIVDGAITWVNGSGWVGDWNGGTKELDLSDEKYTGATHFAMSYNVGTGNGVDGYDFSGYAIEFE